jgi:hypothetical protein
VIVTHDLSVAAMDLELPLRHLYRSLVGRFGALVEGHEDGHGWIVIPTNSDAVGVSWWLDVDSIAVQVLSGAELGGLWELWDADGDTVRLVEDMIWSVAGGRAVELLGPGRSTMRITLSDGTVHEETGGGLPVPAPAPGWRDRAFVKRYAAWGATAA